MHLFEIKDHVLIWAPQALALKPFKALWTRDKSKDKNVAHGELAFIFYFCDGRSDFNNILDKDQRQLDILEQVAGLPENWVPDEKVKLAMKFYEDRSKTVSSMLLEDAEFAAKKLSNFLRHVDLEEKDSNGKYINDAKKFADTLEKTPKVVESLQETAKKVRKEQQEDSGARGSAEKGTFEDGIDE